MTYSSVRYGVSPGTISPRTEAFILQATRNIGTLCTLSHSVVSDSLWPMAYSPARLPCPWNFPGKYTGVACLFYTRDLPNPGIEPKSLASPALAGEFFTTELPGKSVLSRNGAKSITFFNFFNSKKP